MSNNAALYPKFARLAAEMPAVCRLGLATRGNTHLTADDIHHAVEAGVRYLNWCGHADGMSAAIRELGSRRNELVLAVQLSATSRDGMRREFEDACKELGTSRIDVPTFYWMESREQWSALSARDGGAAFLQEMKAQKRVGLIGLTSHQRKLAAEIAEEDGTDLLMVRYNAAHTGAERDVFPVTARCQIPVVAYTCLRWGALTQSTPDDPPEFSPPRAPAWYRWVLRHSGVAVALMAPDSRSELEENLRILEDWQPLSEVEYAVLSAHGARVYKHAGGFP